MSGLVTTTPSTDSPVTRAQLLTFIRQNAGVDDDLVDALILMATEQVEIITEYKLQDATFTQWYDGFPRYANGNQITDRYIELQWAPLVSVASVKYTDQDGSEQTIASTNYIVSNKSEAKSRIIFNRDFTLPTVNENITDTVFVEYVAGYEGWQSGTPGVPATLVTAVKYFVAEIYEHRLYQEEGSITGTLQDNKFAMQLLGSYRRNTPTAIGRGAVGTRNVR